MDMNTVLGSLLSSDSIRQISKASGASQKDVEAVLHNALPDLLRGAAHQANDSRTAAGFAGALAHHAKSDTRDLGSFLSQVDLIDGGKIIGHLLGANTNASTAQTAAAAGVDPAKVAKILAVAAPLLMSLLGQQSSQSSSNAGVGSLLGSLLGGSGGGDLLGALLGVSQPTTTAKKKKTSSAKKPGTAAAKKPASAAAKKTGTSAKKTGTTAKKPGTTAKKTGTTAKKPSSTAKKKPAAKKDETALLDALVGLLK